MPPLLSEKEKDVIDSGDESDDCPMSTQVLEDIHDGIQTHLIVNSRESYYKIHDSINQRQSEMKIALKSTRNMGKGLHKVFKTVVNDIFRVSQLWENPPISFQKPETLLKIKNMVW